MTPDRSARTSSARAKASLTRGYVKHFETAGQLARAAAQIASFDLDEDEYDRFVPRIDAVTEADIASTARAFLHPDESAIVVVGDAARCQQGTRIARSARRPRTNQNSDAVKAVRFHQHGGPEVLRYEDAPDPVPAPGWILVRVRACALNHLDLWQRRGLERVTIPLPHISGADVAGEIAALGEGVTAVRAGDRVMLQPGLSCGRCARCLAGEDNFCPTYDVLGYQSDGGYAELVTVPAANAIPLPEAIDFITAAAFPLSFLTAWHMLHTRARLSDGETVLVVAAGSGVGQAAVQLAKAAGARVIATAGSDAKLAKAKSIGADDVIDHHHDDVVGSRAGAHRAAAAWTSWSSTSASRRGTEACGRSRAAGGWSRAAPPPATMPTLDLRHLFARQLSLLGSYMGGKPELLRAAELFFRGVVRPIVDRTFPLSETAQAHRHLESSAQFGKVVLAVEWTMAMGQWGNEQWAME